MDKKDLLKKYSETSTIRALVQLIPYVGGSIDTLLNEKGNKWRQERIELFIKNFGKSIEEIIKTNSTLESKINNKIDSEDFYDLFLSCLRESITTRHKEKIKLFSNILLNYTTNIITENDDIDLILNIVSNISIKEFFLLKNINENKGSIEYHKIERGILVNIHDLKLYFESHKINYEQNNNIPTKLIIPQENMFMISRLQTMLLINMEKSNGMWSSINYSWSTNVQSFQSSIPYNAEIKITLTDFGKSFINWIKNEQ